MKKIIFFNSWTKHGYIQIFITTALQLPENWNSQHGLRRYNTLFRTMKICSISYRVARNYWFHLLRQKWWKMHIFKYNTLYIMVCSQRKWKLLSNDYHVSIPIWFGCLNKSNLQILGGHETSNNDIIMTFN